MTFLSEKGTLDKPFFKAQKGFVKNFVGKKTLRIVSSLVALSLLGSCASYTTVTPDVSTIQNKSKCAIGTNDVKVCAYPIITNDDGKKFFDTDNINNNGFLPIDLIITNQSKNDSIVLKSIKLINGDTNISPLSPSDATEYVRKNMTGRAVGWFILTGGIGAIASVASTSSVNKKIMIDLINKELKFTEVSPLNQTNGFTYFKIDDKIKDLNGFKVDVAYSDQDAIHTVEIPLEGNINTNTSK